jgi:hypothetical protein
MTTNTVTENTPVTVTLPLGLARTIVTALAHYAEETNNSRLENEAGSEWDARVLQFIAGACDLVREAAREVEPEFSAGAKLTWLDVAPNAHAFLSKMYGEGLLAPGAIAAALGEVETECQANAA